MTKKNYSKLQILKNIHMIIKEMKTECVNHQFTNNVISWQQQMEKKRNASGTKNSKQQACVIFNQYFLSQGKCLAIVKYIFRLCPVNNLSDEIISTAPRKYCDSVSIKIRQDELTENNGLYSANTSKCYLKLITQNMFIEQWVQQQSMTI